MIRVRGAREHNLRDVDVAFPRGRLTVLTGPSGSGKSTLAFDTIFAEAQRRYLEGLAPRLRARLGRRTRPDVDGIDGLPPTLAVAQLRAAPGPRSTVGTLSEIHDLLRLLWARAGTVHCPRCDRPVERTEPVVIVARALDRAEGTRLLLLAPLAGEGRIERARRDGFVRVRVGGAVHPIDDVAGEPAADVAVDAVVDRIVVRASVRSRLHDSVETAVRAGDGRVLFAAPDGAWEESYSPDYRCATCDLAVAEPRPASFSFNSPAGACPACSGLGERTGEPGATATPCGVCGGRRYRPEALAVRVGGRDLAALSALDLAGARTALVETRFEGTLAAIVRPIVEEATARLDRLLALGLDHLSLDRRGPTLSGGELQRVRLANRLGSELVGVLYVLDEPTIGLHPADTVALIGTLRSLRDAGNTLLVVEHDPAVIRAADHLIEIGPGAGREGGRVVAEGPASEVLAGDGATARALRGESAIPARSPSADRHRDRDWLVVEGATAHNLRDVDVRIPLGALVAVTGVSGAGKSTLARDVILAGVRRALGDASARPGPHRRLGGASHFERAVEVTSSRLARSERSIPATAAGVFGPIRSLFAQSEDARIRGYGPERFSFNRRGGRCEACRGLGERAVAMDFLPDVRVRCDLCGGRRYDRETLAVRFRGLDIAEVLGLGVAEARAAFAGFERIAGPLAALERIGLGYLPLGQPARTLSGGEAQRIRLATELGRRTEGGRSLYLLDEPTTGLHVTDVARLVAGLRAIVDRGDTVLVVEHDLELIAAADWVVDLGLGAGPAGGRLIAAGPPEEVESAAKSLTGRFLADRARANRPPA